MVHTSERPYVAVKAEETSLCPAFCAFRPAIAVPPSQSAEALLPFHDHADQCPIHPQQYRTFVDVPAESSIDSADHSLAKRSRGELPTSEHQVQSAVHGIAAETEQMYFLGPERYTLQLAIAIPSSRSIEDALLPFNVPTNKCSMDPEPGSSSVIAPVGLLIDSYENKHCSSTANLSMDSFSTTTDTCADVVEELGHRMSCDSWDDLIEMLDEYRSTAAVVWE